MEVSSSEHPLRNRSQYLSEVLTFYQSELAAMYLGVESLSSMYHPKLLLPGILSTRLFVTSPSDPNQSQQPDPHPQRNRRSTPMSPLALPNDLLAHPPTHRTSAHRIKLIQSSRYMYVLTHPSLPSPTQQAYPIPSPDSPYTTTRPPCSIPTPSSWQRTCA